MSHLMKQSFYFLHRPDSTWNLHKNRKHCLLNSAIYTFQVNIFYEGVIVLGTLIICIVILNAMLWNVP